MNNNNNNEEFLATIAKFVITEINLFPDHMINLQRTVYDELNQIVIDNPRTCTMLVINKSDLVHFISDNLKIETAYVGLGHDLYIARYIYDQFISK